MAAGISTACVDSLLMTVHLLASRLRPQRALERQVIAAGQDKGSVILQSQVMGL